MTDNRHRGSTLDSFLEEVGIPLVRAKVRPTRRALKTEELPAEMVQAIEATDFAHIDPELDKLLD